MLSLASGISLPAMGVGGGGKRKAQGKGERGRQNTLYHKSVSQEMKLHCVCLLTKMSNACLMLGNFHIHFRDLTAFCLISEEFAQGLRVRVFLFFFFRFFFCLSFC